MLVGVETGYEGMFDFPVRDEMPRVSYMLATVPRTGSSYLSHVLWQTGCLGAPLEYLNFDKEGPYFFAAQSPDNQQWLWRSVLRRRTSPNGVFGIKCFLMQLHSLHESNQGLFSAVMSALLPAAGPRRIIYLGRRDRIAHAVSYARASLSGIWRKEQEAGMGEQPEYSQQALETVEGWIDDQSAAWEAMFRDLRIEPLRLWYEDVVERPGEAALQVAEYLGVTLDPRVQVRVPPVLRQSEAESRSWAERYAEARRAPEGAAP